MKYIEMNQTLSTTFPSLKEDIKDLEEYWYPDNVPTYILYENVFLPYLLRLLEKEGQSEERATVFHFLEEMAKSEDKEVVNLLSVGIIEHLFDDEKTIVNAKKYMHNNTLFEAKKTGEFLKGNE